MKKYFQSASLHFAPAGSIDREQGIIQGITVAMVGYAKGHDGFIDKTFLQQLVNLTADRPQGIKARYGHPNMCATALGSYLGRFHNYTLHNDRVKADLHLDETAKTAPQGNIYDYVLDMAEKNPDMFGASIVFEADEFEYKDDIINDKPSKLKLFRIKEIRATDIVDEPAATESLFSADTLPGLATTFLDNNPALTEFIFTKPQAVIEFLNNYLSSMYYSKSIKSAFRKIFNLEQDPPDYEQVYTDPVTGDQYTETDLGSPVEYDSDGKIVLGRKKASDYKLDDDKEYFSKDEYFHMLHELSVAQDEIYSLKSQLAARPTLPKQVTDPMVSVSLEENLEDESGKQMLKSIPNDLRYHLRKATKPKS